MVDVVTAFRLLPKHDQRAQAASFTLCVLISSLCLIMAIAEVASGATYYLDAVGGNDSNPGTGEQPWKTLAKTQSVAVGGDSVYMRNGDYGAFGDSTSNRNNWITYKADAGETDVVFTYIELGQWNGPFDMYLIFDGITVTPGRLYTGTPNYRRGVNSNRAVHLKFKNMNIIGSGYTDRDQSAGIWMQYCSDVEINNVSIYGPPTGTDYEGGFSYGIYGRQSDDVIVTDCNVANCEFGIMAWGTNWTVRKNLIHDLDSDGILGISCKNGVFEDNNVYNIRIPIYVKDTSGSSYVDATKTITAGSGAPYANVKNSDSVRITKNGQKTSFYYISSHTDITITLQSAIGQDYTNIDLVEVKEWYHSDGFQLYNAAVSESEYVRPENIIIRRNRFHDLDQQGLFMRFGPLPTYPWHQTALGMTIENNLIYNVGQLQPSVALWIDQTEHIDFCNNDFLDGNCFFKTGAVIDVMANNIFGTVAIVFTDANVPDPNYEDYNFARTWIKYPGHNTGAHDVVYGSDASFNALFVDAANGDFRLTERSIARDFGDPAYAPATDIDGNPRDSLPDAGCYEYINKSPVLDQIGDKSVNEGSLLTFTVSATDPDGDTLTYSAQNLPSGATFAGQTFSWTPGYDRAGTYQVTFIVSDRQAQDSETITISVVNVNRPPVLALIGDKSVGEGTTLDFTVSASDADGDAITYSVQNLPSGAVFASQRFTWTPAYNQAGTYQVTFTVSDGQAQDSETISISVENVNRTPVLSSIGNKSAYANELLTFSVQATDADNDQIQYSAQGLPSGATFASQNFSWTPSPSQAGSYPVTFIATDGQSRDSEAITITVHTEDKSPPSVTNCWPAANSIQAPLNSLLTLHIVDAGKGVDASTVTIQVSGDTVYPGNNNCRRTGTKEDYTFTYQADENFDYEQEITVTVNAADLGGNVMPEYTHSFWTEMRSFGKNKRVSLGIDNLGSAAPSTVRASNGNIYAVWHAGPAGSRDIYVNKLADEAANFTGSIQLIADPADQCNPAIALGSSDKLYVVWQDNRRGNWDVYISTSVDGVNWSAERLVTDSNDNQINPAIAIDGSSPSRAYVVWQDDRGGNQDIYVASSSDGFATKAVSQITANASDQIDPAIAVNSANTVYVVWTDKRNGSNDIYGAASNSGPWTNVPIVNKAGNQSSPAIAAETAGSILHLLWVDDASGNSDIYHAATNGLPSTPVTGSSIIDDSSGRNQVEPVIAVTGSTGNNLEVFACWQDRRNVAGASGDTDLYFAEVTSDGGTNVFVGDDSTNSNQSQPAIGVDAQGHPYLVWSDSRSANAQIYYAGSTYLDPEPLASQLVSASVGAIVGTRPENIDSVDDVSVIIPPGACSCDLQITISEIKNPQEFTVPCLAAYDFGPSGIQFNQPVTITIPYAVPASQGSVTPYWFNSLTGALSQQGITDIKDIVISPTLHALFFKTTHFTPFYVVEGTAGGTGGGGGGGGCSVSATGNGSIVEFLLPYVALAAAMMILRLRDAHQRKERRLTKSES